MMEEILGKRQERRLGGGLDEKVELAVVIQRSNWVLLDVIQGRSYHRISDTGPPRYRGANMCNYSPTNRVLIHKKGPLRTSYASDVMLHY
ncbi:hypothetical protein TNCV_1419491 [Trichonephila clavipes]|nr:hypothetical protein TNCV_1419491 [Trichonephila clavipes]